MAMDMDSMDCCICLNEFKSPKILSCFHSFCKVCLSSHIDKCANNGFFPCPLCRCLIKIPNGGVDEFTNNFYIRAPHQGDSDVTHRRHCETQTRVKYGQPSFCDEHDKEMDLFCRDCNVQMCCKCLLLIHKQHNFVDKDEIITESKKELNELKDELAVHLSERNTFVESLQIMKAQLSSDRNRTCLKVDELTETTCKVVKELGTNIKHEVNSTSASDETELLASAKQCDRSIIDQNLDLIAKAVQTSSLQELLAARTKVKSDMASIRNFVLMAPTSPSPSLTLFKMVDLQNFSNMLQVELESKIQDRDPQYYPIKNLLQKESGSNELVPQNIVRKVKFKSPSMLNTSSQNSSEINDFGTSWILSVGQTLSSNAIWITLMFKGFMEQRNGLNSVNIKFTLTLINKDDSQSVVHANTKTFGNEDLSYSWIDVISKTELTNPQAGFLDETGHFTIFIGLTIMSMN